MQRRRPPGGADADGVVVFGRKSRAERAGRVDAKKKKRGRRRTTATATATARADEILRARGVRPRVSRDEDERAFLALRWAGASATRARAALRALGFETPPRKRKRRSRGDATTRRRDADAPSSVGGDERDHDDDDVAPREPTRATSCGDSPTRADSDSDVVFLEEVPAAATKRPKKTSKNAADDVDVARDVATALGGLLAKSERGFGNCMFCAVASGLTRWLEETRDDAIPPLARDLELADGDGDGEREVTWVTTRRALVRTLLRLVRDAPAAATAGNASSSEKRKNAQLAREIAMRTLMTGAEGRAWLHQGALANASTTTRLREHLRCMASDAKPHAGTPRWTRYWGTDVELVALASGLRVGVACVECAGRGDGGAYVASPYAFGGGGDGGPLRLGKYTPRGETTDAGVVWSAARGKATLRVRSVKASSKAARAAARRTTTRFLPAIVVVHRPGHFDSLQPPPGRVLVLEREAA